jgi:hypothetical protein|tara:strand:+ start:8395 stop:8691 length:297 start_codon:yes stop_codon:yes gene_type:complete
MKRILILLSCAFGPVLMVLGLGQITRTVADTAICCLGAVALSWAILNIHNALITIYSIIDDAVQAIKDEEQEAVDLTSKIIKKLWELQESAEKQEKEG